MRVYAFIFARGGSKGLPRKNIKKLAGLPLLAHSIQMAQKLDYTNGIYVSTDCPEIEAVANEYGAEVIKRPAELATDTASEWMAWQHAISFLKGQGRQFDVFLSLPTTSPLRAKCDVDACISALDESADVVITVTPSARSPYFNMVNRKENGISQVVIGQANFKRRQDVPSVYDITTVAYVARPEFILNHNALFEGRVKSVIVPKLRAIDIDDEIDFVVAETLIKNESHYQS